MSASRPKEAGTNDGERGFGTGDFELEEEAEETEGDGRPESIDRNEWAALSDAEKNSRLFKDIADDGMCSSLPRRFVLYVESLTIADIHLIHQIILRAKNQWGEGLFTAYVRIVEEEEGDPRDAANNCFRFLARMQQRPDGALEAPMERFKTILSNAGIEVSLEGASLEGREGDALEEFTEQTEPNEAGIAYAGTYKDQTGIVDDPDESRTHREWTPLNGEHSPENESSPQAELGKQLQRSDSYVSTKLIDLPPRKRSSFASLRSQSQVDARHHSGLETRGRLNGRTSLEIELLFHSRQSSMGSHHKSARNGPNHNEENLDYSDDESGNLAAHSRRHSIGSLSEYSNPPQFHLPSSNYIIAPVDMLENEDGFRTLKRKKRSRDFLGQWRENAVDLQRKNQREAARASDYHDEVLLVKYLFKWRRKMAKTRRAEDHQRTTLLSKTITHWRRKTVECKRRIRHDEAKATNFSNGILLLGSLFELRQEAARRKKIRDSHQGEILREAFTAWRDRLEKRYEEDLDRQVNEEDERKAGIFRRIGLLSKALSHWRQTAQEAVRNTATARRHMLRTKYFHHWREITISNELEVRRHIFGKFVGIWQQRTARVLNDYTQAATIDDTNSTRRAYHTFVQAFLEREAPKWRGLRVMRKFFNTWRDIIRLKRERNELADKIRRQRVQDALFKLLITKLGRKQAMETAAHNLRNRKLLTSNIETWKKQAQLAPRAREIFQRVDGRIAYTAFTLLHKRSQLARQASYVNKQRIIRNAFTQWNDLLRVRYLQDKVNERILTEALYRWVIAGRATAAVGRRNLGIGRNCFTKWMNKAHAQRQHLHAAEENFLVTQRQLRLRATFSHWRLTAQSQEEMESMANTHHNNRLLGPVLSRWRIQNTRIQLMNNKVEPARFFLLTTSAFKCLKTATTQHRKQRRREAYDHIRRRVKMNLARGMLNRMHTRLVEIRAMERTATQRIEDRATQATLTDLNAWRAKAVQVVQQTQEADLLYKQRALGSIFKHWRNQQQEIQRMEQEADSFAIGWTAVDAINCLRALDFRLFKLRGQEQLAISWREKHEGKHVKNMLRYWAERALASQRERDNEGNHPAPPNNQDNDGDEDEDDENNDDHPPGINLGPGGAESHDELQAFTPLPAYLRTPSKKQAVRSQARERLGSGIPIPTPLLNRRLPELPATAPARPASSIPIPPFGRGGVTPFGRKLQDQGYPERKVQSGTRKQALSLSVGGRGSRTPGRPLGFAGFEDIPEDRDERLSSPRQ
jgi:hypothetical protein